MHAGGSRVKDCLEAHREDADFSAECKEEFEAMMEARAADFRLDSSLSEACASDIEDVCGYERVCVWPSLPAPRACVGPCAQHTCSMRAVCGRCMRGLSGSVAHAISVIHALLPAAMVWTVELHGLGQHAGICCSSPPSAGLLLGAPRMHAEVYMQPGKADLHCGCRSLGEAGLACRRQARWVCQ